MEEKISEIKFDKKFIQALLDKLKVGNTRSIHLNALPGRSATRLDISRLDQAKDGLSSDFLETLLKSENFSFSISFDSVDLGEMTEDEKKSLALLSKRLNNLVIENNDCYLEFGIKNFGFGFPLLIKRDRNDPTKIIKAPLFIWNLDIERSYTDKNTWRIKKEEDFPIKINELLISHLSKDESIQLEKIPKEVLEDGILDNEELVSLIETFLQQLNVQDVQLDVRVEPCPTKKVIEDIANDKPWIQWSGVFGMYRSQKETIIQSTEELLERFDEFESQQLVLDQFQTSTMTPVDTDPSKEEIINTLTKNEIKIIQGPPGTGKSQSITAIIANTLANGGKCLVVCEKKTALDVIYGNLKSIQLDGFATVIDDVNKDRKKVIEEARNAKDNVRPSSFSRLDYERKYQSYTELKDDVNQKYSGTLQKVLGDFTWKELIGLYLRYSRLPNFDQFLLELDSFQAEHSYEEYASLLGKCEEASLLYQDVEQGSEKIFSYISSDFFRSEHKLNTLQQIKNNTKKTLTTLSDIEKYFSTPSSVSKLFKFYNYFSYIRKIRLCLNDKSLHFKVPLSYKKIIDLKKELEVAYSHMDAYESFHSWKFFCSQLTDKEQKIINAFSEIDPVSWPDLFKGWYYRVSLLDFESKNDNGFNKSDTKINQLTLLYRQLKEMELYKILHDWNSKRKEKFSSITYNFNTLYNLRKNKKFNRKNSLRKIIETDFDLFTTIFPIVLTNPVAANAILPLKQGMFDVVIFDEASQLRIADTFTSFIRGKYKIIAGDEHQMPPSNYFESAGSSLDVEEDDFENEEDFLASEEQAVLAEAESLLDYGRNLKNVSKSYLDYHYRSKHPGLIDFSNYAFYGGNLVPFPAQEVYKPIEFRAVNGRYDSRVNTDEVLEVLQILQNEIHSDHNGKYPSVGIATFNINQRNLITEAINQAMEEDDSFAQKMMELYESGLFVKNLENIQGDEKDVIIISTTYGIKSDGKFSQNFARLNRIEGYKLLNVLVTRAKKKLYVCTSIPKESYLSYSQYLNAEGNNRRGILYAYLAYAEAVSNHEVETAETILRSLREKSYEEPRSIQGHDGLSESVFEEEVYQELLDHFDKEQIHQQYKVGGFRLDFLLEINDRHIVLECDGKAYHQSDEAHSYDMYRQKELEAMGYEVYRIWSTNWFQNKESEMQKLKMFVESKIDSSNRNII